MNKHTFRYLLIIFLIGLMLLLITFYLLKIPHLAENTFTEYLVSEDVNKTIELYRFPLEEYPFKLGNFIKLGLRNKSKEIVAISAMDVGIHLFIFSSDGWHKVENSAQNLFTYKSNNNVYSSRKPLPTDMYYLAPRGTEYQGVISDGFMVVNAIPVLDPSEIPIKLRFMVVGTIYRDGQMTDEQVIAYIDVKIVR